MQRVVVLGPGGAGKSLFALRLGELTGLPVTELDQLFWSSDLRPTPPDIWEQVQQELAAGSAWILDGDLGPHDTLEPRLVSADTVVILDLGVLRCAWRAIRRARERADFWWWLVTWRRRRRPEILATVEKHAPHAELWMLRSPRQVARFLAKATQTP